MRDGRPKLEAPQHITGRAQEARMEGNRSQQAPLNRITLSFTTGELQRAYAAQSWGSSRQFVRFSLLLAAVLYVLFGLLDQRMVPEAVGQILLIRAVVVAVLIATFLLSFRPSFVRYFQGAMALTVLVTGGGILGMIAIADQSSGYRYYAGLMLVVMFGQAMLRLRFIYATAATWLVILAYEAISVSVVGAPGDILLNNSFFLVASNILGMFTSYGLEFSMKTVFWQRRMLVEKQAALNIEHSRKTRELEAAREMQLAMLPSCNPDHPVMDMCFAMTTATEVGGDYYDYTEGSDGSLTFVIADAAGHGAQAGVLVGAMKMMFSNHASADGVDQFLHRASRHLRAMRIPKMFLAAAAARVRQEVVEIAGAGLPPALLYRSSNGNIERISLRGIPLGTYAEVEYPSQRVSLDEGDILVFMTDGLPELRNARGKMFGEERTAAAVVQSADGRASQIVSTLKEAASTWIEGSPQNDDMTFVVIKRKTSSPALAGTGTQTTTTPQTT